MIQRITTSEYLKHTDLSSYLSLPNEMAEFRKVELESALSQATEVVENRHNISLREMNLLVTLRSIEGYSNLYHHPISEVTSCKGDGIDTSFVFDGVGVVIAGSFRVLQVAYKTKAVANAERYRIEVLDRAATIFNGNE